jgi:transcriptional regulator with XRE-family HTH domain
MNREMLAEKLIAARGTRPREEVAVACGISVSALIMYEKGERVPKDDIKIRLAKYYGTTVGALFYAQE